MFRVACVSRRKTLIILKYSFVVSETSNELPVQGICICFKYVCQPRTLSHFFHILITYNFQNSTVFTLKNLLCKQFDHKLMLQLYFVVNDSVRNRSIISFFCKYKKIPYFYLLFENYFCKLYSGTEIEEELGYMTNNSKVNVVLANRV